MPSQGNETPTVTVTPTATPVPSPPDLIVPAGEISLEWVDEDAEEYEVHFKVENIGDSTAGSSTACIYLNGAHLTGLNTSIEVLPGHSSSSEKVAGPIKCSGNESEYPDEIEIRADLQSFTTEKKQRYL